ncbi:MAG: TRAP transporter fused permease subunit [Gammaproteobacteria bacterium]|nr:TRAP transporter fused permease subunit [Gammaproteobacteria bacterium]
MTLANTIHERILKLTFLLALSLSGLQLWQGLTSEIPSTYFRPMHLSWVLVLVFLRYPFIANQSSRYYTYGRSIDVFLAALCVWVGYNIIAFDYNQIDHMLYGLATQDFIAGSLIMVLLLEAARRSVGMVMAMIGLCFICYTLYGSVLPDAIANRGFSLERLIRYQVYTASGIFGPALGIAAGTVFIFVLFGAFLEVSGAGRYFIDLANAAVGKYRGGPAKASVIASAALGSISGSSIANTATSGVVTIPMMKKLGYKPEQAAGIEAAASTGGQIMPPIMGAGAFLIAKFTNTPYSDIVLMSIAPAILYFGCTLFYVHLMACKLGMKGEKNLSNTWRIFIFGAHFIGCDLNLMWRFSP